MPNFINIFEMSPRDGLQNETKFIETSDKIRFINQLSLCGFTKIEISSFVSAEWVPQLADASEVFKKIKVLVYIIGIIFLIYLFTIFFVA